MNCPVCSNVLVTVEQDGFSLEMCPVCKGGWLDRKDLARLLGRGGGIAETPPMNAPAYSATPPPQQPRGGIAGLFDTFTDRHDSHHGDHDKHGHDDHDKHGHDEQGKYGKRSVRSRIFDIFD